MSRGAFVRPVQPLLDSVRSHYALDPDLHRVVLNATSWVEANLAVELLAETVPERSLVHYANIREAIKELPRCPMRMAIDLEGLSRVWDMEREGSAWRRTFADDEGDFSIVLLGEGNYCYDIVVRTEKRTLMWMPRNSEEDFLNADIVDLIVERPAVLGAVIDLLQSMGMAFYPTFYLSLEDWRQEYAQTMFAEVVELFGDGAAKRSKQAEDKAAHGTNVQFRGSSEDAGIRWLL